MACAPLLTSGDVLRRLLEAGRGFSLPPAQHADRLRMLEKVKGVHVVAVASALTRLGVYISGVAIATSIAVARRCNRQVDTVRTTKPDWTTSNFMLLLAWQTTLSVRSTSAKQAHKTGQTLKARRKHERDIG